MSHLAIALEQLLNEHDINAAALALATGLNEAQISRWRNGQQTSIKNTCLNRLAAGFSKDPIVHARLLQAQLLDLTTGPGARHVSIQINPGELPQPENTAKPAVLPPNLQNDLDYIRANLISNREVRTILQSLAKLCRNLPVASSAVTAASPNATTAFTPAKTDQLI